ncbi:MAG: hypothetical protein COU81_02125 [Candidatus Portnoybacteria bacterium CG10_big_fil_rev_8_21_14_0_10_36_7]|uniref:Uncharacterized protein n=1 Tax=Candidatus Portnoybacteria bacterium CG10_big_fil_rev_8_21_14_0_10_36_7 TaxID=1974812 RepID=A0A2M8KE51_9BACT|nr:MAG: hypothetical protein COU81_02125 [Candidatus Portnoybacteria bacterium CG10_big_fil_rev_8_21_14_0_10_36_7]
MPIKIESGYLILAILFFVAQQIVASHEPYFLWVWLVLLIIYLMQKWAIFLGLAVYSLGVLLISWILPVNWFFHLVSIGLSFVLYLFLISPLRPALLILCSFLLYSGLTGVFSEFLFLSLPGNIIWWEIVVVFIATVTLTYASLKLAWDNRSTSQISAEGNTLKKKLLPESLIIGVVMSELILVVSFLPFNFISQGATLSVAYLFLYSIFANEMAEKLSKKIIIKSIVVAVVAIIVIFASISWHL